MANKSITHGTSRQLLIGLIVAPGLALAQQCVLQSKIVSQSQIQIEERSQITAQVVPLPSGNQRCMITMRGRIGATWYTGFGDTVFRTGTSADQACVSAQRRAEASIAAQAGTRQVASDDTLVCKDDPSLDSVRTAEPGTVAKLAQYRPHPDYPREFVHQGTKCRWFLDPAWTGRELRTGQGIICHLQNDNWVVVDKF